MRVAVFSTKPYDRVFLSRAAADGAHEFVFHEHRLTDSTAILAEGCDAVCAFVNDQMDAATIERLRAGGVRLIALRSAGYNNVDLEAASRAGIAVAHVPAYSPHAVAEHAMALILALNRHIPRAHARVRDGNFDIEGLLGFDLYGCTAGVVGTGAIGRAMATILLGFGCEVLAYDPYPNEQLRAQGVTYGPLDEVFARARVISLHCPLTEATRHLVNAESIARMVPGVMLVNTSRGGLVDTPAVIEGLKDGQIGALGLDVYEEEAGLFFENLSGTVIQDDVLMRLMTFPNVLVTSHQAFYTREALQTIAATTIGNLDAFAANGSPLYAVSRG